MRTPLRIIQTKTIEKGVKRFLFLKGLKTICKNLSLIFTSKLLSEGSGWIEIIGETEATVSDHSLIIQKDGTPRFVPTLLDRKNSIGIEISQSVNE